MKIKCDKCGSYSVQEQIFPNSPPPEQETMKHYVETHQAISPYAMGDCSFSSIITLKTTEKHVLLCLQCGYKIEFNAWER
jgi:hypothetical protein